MIFMACGPARSQSISESSSAFEDQLAYTLAEINATKSIEGFFDNINKLKRLSSIYPREWLADYYVALLDIKLSLGMKDGKKKESLLRDAKETLATLKEKENSVESEILTLDGYYYYALIAMNPSKNGQIYYKDVIGAYQKAIAIDKNNPRPALMLLIFKNMMSKFNGGDNSDICDDLTEIKHLFSTSKPTSEIYPKWGLSELKKQREESCNL